MALVLSCADCSTPAELIFDVGVGEIVSVRISGPLISDAEIGSIEYGCVIAGAKLIVVLGHTRCSALNAAADEISGCRQTLAMVHSKNLGFVVEGFGKSIDPAEYEGREHWSYAQSAAVMDCVSRRNVAGAIDAIFKESSALAELAREGQIVVVGALFDDPSGNLEFLS